MYVRPFDPWSSSLCTCPPKYTLNVYTGCDHACVYCYITSYIPHAFRVREKKGLLGRLEGEILRLKRRDENALVALSYSSDPYPTVEKSLGTTRKVLKLLARHDVRCLILTKSDIFRRDIDVLKNMRCAVGVSVTTVNEEKAGILEPNAPAPERRIDALKKARDAGIPVYARVDPIIPFYTWEDFEMTLEELSFVSHVTVSTLKLRPDSMRRMKAKFPELMAKLAPLYRERIGGYLYLPRNLRLDILREARRLVLEKGLTFGSCREGYVSWPTCDASHLVP
ncbi:MAG: radical SAM protein [Thermococci archaeon]|nr:radical SAM protein [Thermococci archaeon]